MNSLADKLLARNTHTFTLGHLLTPIFVIFLIFIIFHSSQAQDQWRVFTTQNSQLPSNTVGSIVIDTNNVKWIGTVNGMVRIVGNNWQIFDSTNTPLGTNGIGPVALDSLNNIWCILTSKGIAKFDGFVWEIYNSTNSGLPTNNIIYISIDISDNKWIGSTAGLTKFDNANWTTYNTTNSGLPSNIVTSVAIENQIKWVGTFSLTGGMAKFNDTNWTVYNSTNSGLPSNNIRYISLDTGNNKWICMDFGGLAKFNSALNNWIIYNTTNSGIPGNSTTTIKISNYNIKLISVQNEGLVIFNDNNWQIFNMSNSPLPSNTISRIEIDKLSNTWISTAGGLAIYNPAGIVYVRESRNQLSESFQLLHNYPNPFNPVTSIEYEIKKASMVMITVFDINGKKVKVLVNTKQSRGKYKVNFDGSRFASGIYFYKMQCDDFEEVKKMVLLK